MIDLESPQVVHSSRRTVLASGTGIIAGFSGCFHTRTGTIDGFERENVDPYRRLGDGVELGGSVRYRRFGVSDRVTRFGEYAGMIVARNTHTHWVSFPGDGLPRYPRRGDVFEFWMHNEQGDGAISAFFGVQEGGPAYRVDHEYAHNRLAIYKGGAPLGTKSTGNLSGEVWRKYQVEWGESGRIRFSLPDEGIDLVVEDSTWNAGGFGWGLGWHNFNGAGYFDGALIVG